MRLSKRPGEKQNVKVVLIDKFPLCPEKTRCFTIYDTTPNKAHSALRRLVDAAERAKAKR